MVMRGIARFMRVAGIRVYGSMARFVIIGLQCKALCGSMARVHDYRF